MSTADMSAGIRSASFLHRDTRLARLARPIARFMQVEAAGGILLVIATAIALIWANSPWHGAYEALWATPFDVTIGSFKFHHDLHHVVNDGLMAIFFLVVGLEIKRELVTGELRDRRQVALPAVAALGGMVVPALIFTAFNIGTGAGRGWGVPMATDIAFAVGVMAVLGKRVPAPLKVFLLGLAIADDLGAIVVIAVFYSDGISGTPLAVAAGITAALVLLRRLHVVYAPIYIACGLLLWYFVHESGVHATIAGVVVGLLTPATPLRTEIEVDAVVDVLENRNALTSDEVMTTAVAIRESFSVAERLVVLLHPWTSYLIVPAFALANAGIVFEGNPLDAGTGVFLGVGLGLVLGKCIGIGAFGWLVVRLGLAVLPAGVRWTQFVAAAALAGIGFTVSLFVTGLAFTDPAQASSAKIAILVASAVAAVGGSIGFAVTSRSVSDGRSTGSLR